MVNNKAPQTLTTLLPQKTSERSNYNLRNPTNYTPPSLGTTSLQQTFIPDTTTKWNKLPLEIRQIKNTEQFKQAITPEKLKIPERFYIGNRRAQILQTRLRLGCSDLNNDLYQINLGH